MATKNDITGDAIASRVATQSYRDGWDRIFAKKTPDEWLKDPAFVYVRAILDPDGWRMDNLDYDTPLTQAEFSRRLSYSTILTKNNYDQNQEKS
jgi:hypothetical protein